MRTLIARMQEMTGIYGAGFDKDSIAGIVLPIAFVIVVGGICWYFIR